MEFCQTVPNIYVKKLRTVISRRTLVGFSFVRDKLSYYVKTWFKNLVEMPLRYLIRRRWLKMYEFLKQKLKPQLKFSARLNCWNLWNDFIYLLSLQKQLFAKLIYHHCHCTLYQYTGHMTMLWDCIRCRTWSLLLILSSHTHKCIQIARLWIRYTGHFHSTKFSVYSTGFNYFSNVI